MKRGIFTTFLLLSLNLAHSQEVFRPVWDSLAPMPAPVDKLYDSRPMTYRGFIPLVENNYLPLQLYTNFQCTDSFDAEYDTISEPFVMMMMEIPETSLKLYSVHVGGITEYAKTVLVLVDAENLVLDTLEAEVCWGPVAMYAKQARIDKIIQSWSIPYTPRRILHYLSTGPFLLFEVGGKMSLTGLSMVDL